MVAFNLLSEIAMECRAYAPSAEIIIGLPKKLHLRLLAERPDIKHEAFDLVCYSVMVGGCHILRSYTDDIRVEAFYPHNVRTALEVDVDPIRMLLAEDGIELAPDASA